MHFNGHYWCDYALDATSPITWRYRGGPGTGALADVGSHLLDLSEFICGPITEVSGAAFTTLDHPASGARRCHLRPHQGCGQRGAGAGRERGCRHLHREVRQRRGGHILSVARRAQPARRPRLRTVRIEGLGVMEPAPAGRVRDFDGRRPQRHRRAAAGADRAGAPVHPRRLADGLPAASVTVWPICSAIRPAPSWTRSPASTSLGRCPASTQACTGCASSPRSPNPPSPAAQPSKSPLTRTEFTSMKLGVYTAILHDKPLRGSAGSHRLSGPDRR